MKKTKSDDTRVFRRYDPGRVCTSNPACWPSPHCCPETLSKGGAFDAFCPFGGIETLWAYITTGQTLKTTNLLNFTVLLAVLGVSYVAGRAFVGGCVRLGTLQDMFAGWARRLSGEKKQAGWKKK